MNVNEINRQLSAGSTDGEGLLPHLENLKGITLEDFLLGEDGEDDGAGTR